MAKLKVGDKVIRVGDPSNQRVVIQDENEHGYIMLDDKPGILVYAINLIKVKESALGVQVGGGHYKDYVIQPIEFTMKNKLNFCQGNIIKYITRYKDKNGLEDLKKAKHYIDLLIELEYTKK